MSGYPAFHAAIKFIWHLTYRISKAGYPISNRTRGHPAGYQIEFPVFIGYTADLISGTSLIMTGTYLIEDKTDFYLPDNSNDWTKSANERLENPPWPLVLAWYMRKRLLWPIAESEVLSISPNIQIRTFFGVWIPISTRDLTTYDHDDR